MTSSMDWFQSLIDSSNSSMGAWAGDLTAPSLVPDAVTGALEGVKPSTACDAQRAVPKAVPSDKLAVPAAAQQSMIT